MLNTGQDGRGRPSIIELLDEENLLGVCKTSLREMTHVALAISHFPILAYSNEPISHISEAAVKPLIAQLADHFTEMCDIPESIGNEFPGLSPFTTNVGSLVLETTETPGHSLVPNDGDGLVELNNGSLNGAVFHRLYGIDAPELYTTYFIRVGNNIFTRRNGHISHLAVHFYLYSFSRPKGTALIYFEHSEEMANDIYGRKLSSIWFKWSQSPTPQELSILNAISAAIVDQEIHVKARLMSCFDPRMATAENCFYLNLNALLVVTGFCLVFTK